MSLLDIQNLQISYGGLRAVQGATFNVDRGETFVLLCANGAGKSSILRAISSLVPRLAERRNQMAGTMSGGEQQALAIGRGLMNGPSLLMLDEPSLGLSPLLAGQVFEQLASIREQGISLLVAERLLPRHRHPRPGAGQRPGGAARYQGRAAELRFRPQGQSGALNHGQAAAQGCRCRWHRPDRLGRRLCQGACGGEADRLLRLWCGSVPGGVGRCRAAAGDDVDGLIVGHHGL